MPPGKTVVKFLKWYWDNEKRIDNTKLVNMPNDEKTPYSIDEKKAKNYLSILKSSGFLSNTYIQTWNNYFKEYKELFKKEAQYEGSPTGFDYNFIMQSNDPEERPAKMSNIKISDQRIEGNKAYVVITFPSNTQLYYTLSKHNNKWQIDEITPAVVDQP